MNSMTNTASPSATAHYRFKPWNVGRIVIWSLFAIALIVAPMLFRSSLALTMLSQIGYLIIICLSYNMLLGQGGMLSFGHAVYSGLGSFAAIHVLNTTFDLLGKAAFDDYMLAWDRILKARPDMIWYPTTCNNNLVAEGDCGLEHVHYLNKHANVQIAVVDTGIDQFVIDEDEEGNAVGRAYGWNLTQVARQVKFCRERDIAMIWGVYEPGHLRVARHYVDRGMFTKGSNWDFYFVGKYGLTSEKPIGTCGMEPSLESLYYYLDMISQAKHKLPWFISIWGEGEACSEPCQEQVRKVCCSARRPELLYLAPQLVGNCPCPPPVPERTQSIESLGSRDMARLLGLYSTNRSGAVTNNG